MALAAFKLVKCTGTNAGMETDCSKHPTFLSADVVSTETGTYPIAVPVSSGASPNYSYELWIKLECTIAPDNYCHNFKIWGPENQPDSADTPGDRMTIYIGSVSAGDTPVDTVSSYAVAIQHKDNSNGHYSEATAYSVNAAPGDAKIDAVGEQTYYVVLQLKVQDQAQQGDIQTVLFNWSYDEA